MRAFPRVLLALVLVESALGYGLARGLNPPVRIFRPPPTWEQEWDANCDGITMLQGGTGHFHLCDTRSL